MGCSRLAFLLAWLAVGGFSGEVGQLVNGSRLPAGLVVMVGDPEPGADAALVRSGRWLVHRLAPRGKVEELRRVALEAGLHGRLVIGALPEGGRLPHPDRFADVVVADLDAGAIAETELLRVLNVAGTAVLRKAGQWRTVPRPAEEGIDDWTHKWHGPSGHPMSLDRKAGPPTAIQWVTGPALADGSTPGKHPVIGSGAFAAVDNVDGAVQVRSAGNGLPRWRSGFALPVLADLVIDEDRLLCRPLDRDARSRYTETGPLVAYDLTTGEEVMKYGDAPQVFVTLGSRAGVSFPASLVVGDRLVVAAGTELATLGRATGKRLWTHTLEQGSWFSPAVLDGVVVAAENAPDSPAKRARIDNAPGAVAVSAFALAGGTPEWRVENVLLSVPKDERGGFARASLLPLVAAEGKVFLHTSSYQCRQLGAYIAALDLRTGKQLWRHDLKEGDHRDKWSSTDSASRVVCREGTLYYMGGHRLGGVAALDAATGKLVSDFQRRPAGFGHNGECTGSLGTVNWLVTSSVTWWDRELKPLLAPAARSSCGTPVFPAQGMVFANPTGCDCTNYARGYLGLRSAPLPRPIPDEQRLVRGPGFGPIGNRKSAMARPGPPFWPTRAEAAQRRTSSPTSWLRSGASPRPQPRFPARCWMTDGVTSTGMARSPRPSPPRARWSLVWPMPTPSPRSTPPRASSSGVSR